MAGSDDMAAVTEVVRTYYEGMMQGDATKLGRAFHPRAAIVGNWEGAVYWATLDEFAVGCRNLIDRAGPYERRVESIAIVGDMATVRLGNQYAGVWYSDDLAMLRSDGAWRIAHKTFYAHPAT